MQQMTFECAILKTLQSSLTFFSLDQKKTAYTLCSTHDCNLYMQVVVYSLSDDAYESVKGKKVGTKYTCLLLGTWTSTIAKTQKATIYSRSSHNA